MTSRELAYWLQGYFELSMFPPHEGAWVLRPEQADLIRAHCKLVQEQCPNDLFALAVGALADDAEALRKILDAQFAVVTRPAPPTPVHPPSSAALDELMGSLRTAQERSGGPVRYC